MAWFTVAGKTCVAAYDAIGASSLADSYVNEANPGTYDLTAPGNAPDWASGTGWTFDSANSEYLSTGWQPGAGDQTLSAFVRFSNYADAENQNIFGYYAATTSRFEIQLRTTGGTNNVLYGLNGNAQVAPGLTSGVLGVAGGQGYRNGSADGGSWSPSAGGSEQTCYIGARNYSTPAYYSGNIQAVAIYSDTLTAGEASTLSTAMAALTAAGAAGLPVIAWEHARIFGP